MKKTALLLFSLAVSVVLPSTSVMAEPAFMRDVNMACGAITVECSVCHDLNDFDEYKPEQDLYESNGACAFCPGNTSCSAVQPTETELLAEARNSTNDYFESLFKLFMKHMKETGKMNPDGSINDPTIFADVFPDCPEIAPVIASDFSRLTGSMMRRVTNRTRNPRNTPDDWEANQLEKFADMAEDGKSRTRFDITKPDGSILPTREYEAYRIVDEGDDGLYFRYMRSITMPGLPNEPPHLPCLKCHGTFDQIGPGVLEAIEAEYPYDLALGYKKGDIRGAWTVKIPLIEEDD